MYYHAVIRREFQFFFWEQKKLGGQIRREPWPRKWFLLLGTADVFSNLNVLQQNFCCRKKKLFSFPTQQILARSVKKRRSYRSSCKVERFADKFVTVTMRKDPVRRHKRLDFPRWQRFICIYTCMWPAVISLAHALAVQKSSIKWPRPKFLPLDYGSTHLSTQNTSWSLFSTKYQLGFPSLYHLMKARGTQPKRRGK